LKYVWLVNLLELNEKFIDPLLTLLAKDIAILIHFVVCISVPDGKLESTLSSVDVDNEL
jgi:hypothetical protein